MPPELHLAVEVALTTGRPLLLRGEPGTGKSSLAPYVARRLGWRYYEHVVTSASTAHGPAVALRRGEAARATRRRGRRKAGVEYVEPGVLWWALDRQSALRRREAAGGAEPDADVNATRDPHRAVVLIDEIDKAHPDLPNGLLVALGSNQIAVPYLARADRDRRRARGAAAQAAEGRRRIADAGRDHDQRGARAAGRVRPPLRHVRASAPGRGAARRDRARAVRSAKDAVHGARTRRSRWPSPSGSKTLRAEVTVGAHRPSTAEFLDAFRACRTRKIVPDPTIRAGRSDRAHHARQAGHRIARMKDTPVGIARHRPSSRRAPAPRPGARGRWSRCAASRSASTVEAPPPSPAPPDDTPDEEMTVAPVDRAATEPLPPSVRRLDPVRQTATPPRTGRSAGGAATEPRGAVPPFVGLFVAARCRRAAAAGRVRARADRSDRRRAGDRPRWPARVRCVSLPRLTRAVARRWGRRCWSTSACPMQPFWDDQQALVDRCARTLRELADIRYFADDPDAPAPDRRGAKAPGQPYELPRPERRSSR